jgi:lipopolysaccharide export LptBFGC system permease protein LptF
MSTVLFIILFGILWALLGILGEIVRQVPDWLNGNRAIFIKVDDSLLLISVCGPIGFFLSCLYCLITLARRRQSTILIAKAREPKI